MVSSEVEVIHTAHAELAEGPVWHEDALWWVNIVAGTLNRLDPSTGVKESKSTGEMTGCAVPCQNGNWLLARRDGFHAFDWNSGKTKALFDPEASLIRNRFNDGKCDPVGRFLAGSLNLDGNRHECSLYIVDCDLSLRQLASSISLSNGLDWSPDGKTFYYIDTLAETVTAFTYDLASGAISNPRIVREFDASEGFPDGMTCDRDGMLWVAMWGKGSVLQLDPDSGRTITTIELPVSQPSSCCFGGPDMRTLYITSAWQSLSPQARAEEPLAGCLFAIEPGTTGKHNTPFAGNITI